MGLDYWPCAAVAGYPIEGAGCYLLLGGSRGILTPRSLATSMAR